jgi:hypothetical protein
MLGALQELASEAAQACEAEDPDLPRNDGGDGMAERQPGACASGVDGELAALIAECEAAAAAEPALGGGGVDERRRAAFVSEMQQRFLQGQEGECDYGAIDRDEALDEDWGREAAQDAEDAYFEDV